MQDELSYTLAAIVAIAALYYRVPSRILNTFHSLLGRKASRIRQLQLLSQRVTRARIRVGVLEECTREHDYLFGRHKWREIIIVMESALTAFEDLVEHAMAGRDEEFEELLNLLMGMTDAPASLDITRADATALAHWEARLDRLFLSIITDIAVAVERDEKLGSRLASRGVSTANIVKRMQEPAWPRSRARFDT